MSINEVSLEHGHTHSFIRGTWLLSFTAGELSRGDTDQMTTKPKPLVTWPFAEKVCGLLS